MLLRLRSFHIYVNAAFCVNVAAISLGCVEWGLIRPSRPSDHDGLRSARRTLFTVVSTACKCHPIAEVTVLLLKGPDSK